MCLFEIDKKRKPDIKIWWQISLKLPQGMVDITVFFCKAICCVLHQKNKIC